MSPVDLMQSTNIQAIFSEPERYDYFLAPSVVRRLPDNQDRFASISLRQWQRSQRTHVRKITHPKRWAGDRVQRGYDAHDHILRDLGVITGNVLDVGGGWGVYRQWWEAADHGHYVIHDPGLDRYLFGPTAAHRKVYARAFSRPAIFVEAYGEYLEYRARFFDSAVATEMLDHCVDPQRVLAGVWRCLKPGGHLLVINHVSGVQRDQSPSLWRRFRKFANKILHPDHHLRHFTVGSLQKLVEVAGFNTTLSAQMLLSNKALLLFEKPGAPA